MFRALIVVSVLFLSGIVVIAQGPPADSPAKVISSEPFVTPPEVEAAGIDGKLTIRAKIDKSGAASGFEIVAGPMWPCGANVKREIDVLQKAVVANLRQAKFSPEIKNGKPVNSVIQLSFSIGEAYQAELRRREREEAQKKGIALPIFVQGGVLTGKALRLPKPDYPMAARSQGVTGSVSVSISFDEQGAVVMAGILAGHPLLQDAARDAACGAKFTPVSLNGKPVKVSGTLVYFFAR